MCAGGTGGGIYPALAVVKELVLKQERIPHSSVLWVGTKGEMEEQIVPRYGFQLETIQGGAMVSVPLQVKLKHGMQLLLSIPKAMRIIRRFKPTVMLMTGGYMAVPVSIACRLLGVPIVIYLPDVEPGRAIKTLLPLSDKVACTVEGSAEFVPRHKMEVTGYPVRPSIREATALTKEAALAEFDLTPARKTLFVFGGSRGAWAINKALMKILPTLLETIQVVHISGTTTWPEVQKKASQLAPELAQYYRPYAYLHERMGAGFQAADLVVARAGASMLGEAPAFQTPSILVPLAWAWRYQKVNADFLTQKGAAVQLTDEVLETALLPTIMGIMNDEDRLQQMANRAARLDKHDATRKIGDILARYG